MGKIGSFFLCVLLCVSLSSCDFKIETNPEELMAPPTLSTEQKKITTEMAKNLPGEFHLKYPAEGDHRSAVILVDLDNDNIEEAVVFFVVPQWGEDVRIFILRKSGDDWVGVLSKGGQGSRIHRVLIGEFAAGQKSLVVGYTTPNFSQEEKKLAAYTYSFDGANASLNEQLSGVPYLEFAPVLLADKKNTNLAVVRRLYTTDRNQERSEKKVLEIYQMGSVGQLEMNSATTLRAEDATEFFLYSEVVVEQNLQTGKKEGQSVLYVDAKFTEDMRQTQAYYLPSSRPPTEVFGQNRESMVSLTSRGDIPTQDMDGDGLYEVPIAVNTDEIATITQSLEESKDLTPYFWGSVNEGVFVKKHATIYNQVAGYIYTLPEKWVGKVEISLESDRQKMEIKSIAKDENNKPIPLVTIWAIPIAQLESTDTSEYEAVGEYTSHFAYFRKVHQTNPPVEFAGNITY